jgi:prepilin-type N-terminal cleavage/methylation domain-containing protein
MAARLQRLPMSTMRRRAHDRGFTLVELMVVLVIVAVLATLSVPMLSRDRRSSETRNFANQIARELQRCRMRALADRLPMYVFVWKDRIEVRSATLGATEGAGPTAPTVASPILTLLRPGPSLGANIYDVVTSPAAPSQTLGTSGTNYAVIVFNTMGNVQVTPMGGVLTSDVPIYLYLRNDNMGTNNQERSYRLDITPLTGYVQLRNSW